MLVSLITYVKKLLLKGDAHTLDTVLETARVMEAVG